MQSDSLIKLVKEYIIDPNNAELNFNIGVHYDNIDQTASAVSYYLRSAERSNNTLLKYESLLRASSCFDRQGSRNFTVKGLIQHAISTCPTRPEAYFYLGRFYERIEEWHECFLITSIGERVSEKNPEALRTELDYPGFYGITFLKSVSSWWCGLCDDSRKTLEELVRNPEISPEYRTLCINNLSKISPHSSSSFDSYTREKFDSYKFKFPGLEVIEKNHSESYQDMFTLSMLNGKRNGTYLEIGAGNSFYGNNTALLETKFDWSGVSLDIEQSFVEAFSNERKNPCLLKNALYVDYDKFLHGLDFPSIIDYLQLDCDPPEITYQILLTIPFDSYKFRVITFEHDYYTDTSKTLQEKSIKYLESYDYVRVVNNIAPDDWRSYEDWWVHPDLVDKDILDRMTCIDDNVKKAEKYMLGSL